MSNEKLKRQYKDATLFLKTHKIDLKKKKVCFSFDPKRRELILAKRKHWLINVHIVQPSLSLISRVPIWPSVESRVFGFILTIPMECELRGEVEVSKIIAWFDDHHEYPFGAYRKKVRRWTHGITISIPKV